MLINLYYLQVPRPSFRLDLSICERLACLLESSLSLHLSDWGPHLHQLHLRFGLLQLFFMIFLKYLSRLNFEWMNFFLMRYYQSLRPSLHLGFFYVCAASLGPVWSLPRFLLRSSFRQKQKMYWRFEYRCQVVSLSQANFWGCHLRAFLQLTSVVSPRTPQDGLLLCLMLCHWDLSCVYVHLSGYLLC